MAPPLSQSFSVRLSLSTRERLHIPQPPAPVRSAARASSRSKSGGFGLLSFLTILAAFVYLSGAVNVARHDALYAALLTVVWSGYFAQDRLMRIRVLGPLLARAGQLSLMAGGAGFFGFLYWIVLTHP